jgi:hypothetical protein
MPGRGRKSSGQRVIPSSKRRPFSAALVTAPELAGNDHQGLADTGGEAAIGLHGQQDRAFADEFQRRRARV